MVSDWAVSMTGAEMGNLPSSNMNAAGEATDELGETKAVAIVGKAHAREAQTRDGWNVARARVCGCDSRRNIDLVPSRISNRSQAMDEDAA
jgi:hypothetical protein